MRWAAGIEIGGTTVEAVAVAADGTVLQRANAATADGIAGPSDWIAAARSAIGSSINLFDPEVVVIGGGVAQAGEASFTPLARVEWRPGGHRVPLVPAQLGESAGAIGTAAYALGAIAT